MLAVDTIRGGSHFGLVSQDQSIHEKVRRYLEDMNFINTKRIWEAGLAFDFGTCLTFWWVSTVGPQFRSHSPDIIDACVRFESSGGNCPSFDALVQRENARLDKDVQKANKNGNAKHKTDR